MADFSFVPLEGFDPVTEADIAALGILEQTQELFSKKYAVLYAGMLDGDRVATVVLKREEKPSGQLEMVIFAAVARGADAVLMAGLEEIETLARGYNCTSIRLHTTRPGLMRKMISERPHGEATYWYEV